MKKKFLYSTLGIVALVALIFGMVRFISSGSTDNSNTTNKKTVHILTYANWNPFEYVKKGKIVGFDIDLIKLLSKNAGYNYTIKNVSWDSMFTQLQNKSADLGIAGITVTSDREKTYDFSNTYFVSRQSIVTKINSNINSASDLKGKKVSVQTGSTGQEAAEKIFGKNSPNILKSSSGVTDQMVMHNQVVAAIGDDTSNKKFVQANPNSGLKVVQDDKKFSPEYFGIMFPKGSKYRNIYNKALKKAIKDGSYTKIYKKWFGIKPDVSALKNTD
ncbi:MAG: transporter substrate-binding domain-containing protein [Liquorilactobacillus hordei]|uniref:Basic amino acid ABC transporter substrate-binding protein n=1 Tax=Liquorilactobacillus hordei TaxID=468911 RepID=A0A3Q8C8E6_9LACO|nr:transporter substrate-binding domain-containing protein [Liquorilactobacillus hordei]AUJ28883.1 basic amino acid ABC transporter substrate-binding protein [Liquorilactobacillus hordei]MBZ2406280.1 basic amino acid ABC transporter substrate-binding protein [Liquorilactobacillus hordei]